MILKDILARELKVWPREAQRLCQTSAGVIFFTPEGFIVREVCRLEQASDWREAIVTRAEWQAAVEALKDEQAAELKWPDGATHYVPPQEKNENGVFYLVVNDDAVYAWSLLKSGIDNGGRVYGDSKRHQLPAAILRPTERAVERGGVGDPPKGTAVEVRFACEKFGSEWPWHAGVVVASGKQPEGGEILVVEADGFTVALRNTADYIRTIRTQEQIAEDVRMAGLNEMIGHIKDHPMGTHGVKHIQELRIHEDAVRDLWEAGYRKQVSE